MTKSKRSQNSDYFQLNLFDVSYTDLASQPNTTSQLPNKLQETEPRITTNILKNDESASLDLPLKSHSNVEKTKSESRERLLLFVPERFDVLERRAKDKLQIIINPVENALASLDDIYSDMISAGRGSFLVLRGTSGSGKSTFLHTVYLFRHGIKTISIHADELIPKFLKEIGEINLVLSQLRIIVLENREALTNFSIQQLEDDLHAINRFIRSPEGERTLIVWPCNSDDLETMLINLAERIGADSLLGIGEPSYRFYGPPKEQYVNIATRTIENLNEGANLVDLGISEELALELAQQTDTIGKYLSLLRKELRKNEKIVEKLCAQEKCQLWIVIIGGNNPEQEVAGLTRGAYSKADISCLMNSTKANVVEDLKRYSDKVGILVTVLEVKIIYLPIATARSILVEYADNNLKEKFKQNGISSLRRDQKLRERINKSQIFSAFQKQPITISRTSRPNSDSRKTFEKISEIAQKNDVLLNKTFGKALQKHGLINSFKTEATFGKKRIIKSDLLCQIDSETIRLELMWTKWASSADIANYVLKKIHNYGRAIEFLE
jgi:energy-coupling factor transporter ATP-binding protein EcfA2